MDPSRRQMMKDLPTIPTLTPRDINSTWDASVPWASDVVACIPHLPTNASNGNPGFERRDVVDGPQPRATPRIRQPNLVPFALGLRDSYVQSGLVASPRQASSVGATEASFGARSSSDIYIPRKVR